MGKVDGPEISPKTVHFHFDLKQTFRYQEDKKTPNCKRWPNSVKIKIEKVRYEDTEAEGIKMYLQTPFDILYEENAAIIH